MDYFHLLLKKCSVENKIHLKLFQQVGARITGCENARSLFNPIGKSLDCRARVVANGYSHNRAVLASTALRAETKE